MSNQCERKALAAVHLENGRDAFIAGVNTEDDYCAKNGPFPHHHRW